jgi:asparagine synthase (glutamine-hydrolysing)
MWAAAICDWAAGRMVLSRDRLGIKPLYITRFSGGMAFASEIKSLLVLPAAARGANEARLRDFLCDGQVDHTDDTLFEGIWSSPAGCWVELDLRARGALHSGGAVRRYWRPAFRWSSVPDAPQQVAQSLSDSVAAHVQGELPIGSSLSGGLDSSAIVSLVHRLWKADGQASRRLTRHTFTASLPGSALDEASYAKAVVQACPGLQWHVTEPTPERLIDDMVSLVWHQEQPFGSPSIYMQWEVMRLAHETGVAVLLEGHGADGLFCGLAGLIPPYLAHLLRQGHVWTFWREHRAARQGHYKSGGLIRHVAAGLLSEQARRRLRLHRYARRQPWLDRGLFSADETPSMCTVLRLVPAEHIERACDGPALLRRLWSRLLRDSLPSVLRFEDRNSMAFSIEGRMPFLARDVVELAMRLPMAQKIKDGSLKVVLREAMRGVVPDVVLDRRDKIGFSPPTADWMRCGLGAWWRDLLASRSFRDRGCFDTKAVEKLVSQFDRGDTSVALDIWRMAIVEQWARQFMDETAKGR